MNPQGASQFNKFILVSGGLFCLWFILFIANIFFGSVAVPLNDIFNVLLGLETSDETYELIIWEYRLPKAIAATFAGGCLAVSGLLMQTLFRNPLAGPFILGTSSGASLGVALIVLGSTSFSFSLTSVLGEFSLITAACIGSGSLMFLVLFASQRIHHHVTLLIMGLMFGYAASALVSILTHFSTAEQIQSFAIWNMGTFSNITWEEWGFIFRFF